MADFKYYRKRDEIFLDDYWIYLSRLEGAYRAVASRFHNQRRYRRARYYRTLASIVRAHRLNAVSRLREDIRHIGDAESLLDFIDIEIGEMHRIKGVIAKEYEQRESFAKRLQWFLDRFAYKKEKVKKIVPKELWKRMIFIKGSYDVGKRNCECHLFLPINEEWDKKELDEKALSVINYFLNISGWKVPFWEEGSSGSTVDKAFPEDYTVENVPKFFKIEVYDYDANTQRSYSEGEMKNPDWIDDVPALLKSIRSNLRLNRGMKKVGRKEHEGEQKKLEER